MESACELPYGRFDSERPPVVLLGGLNVLRALGLAGIPAIVASACDEPAFASRYCRARLHLPTLENPGAVLEALMAAGEGLVRRLGRAVPLFYSNDSWQRFVQDHRAELGRHYRLLLNEPSVADALIEKDRFQALALERGLPIPRTLSWESLERVAGPVLVKPCAKFGAEPSAARLRFFGAHGKARIYASGPALAADPAARQLREETIIQEYIAGGDREIWSFHGFADEQGALLDWFVGRKIRTYPALTGESTYVELAHDTELAELGPRLAAALGLRGVFKIDLKREPRTGRLRVLEVNARYNLWHYLGAANGLNLPLTAYEYLVFGRRPEAPRPYGTRYRWVNLHYDWSAYRELAARGELDLRGWLASLGVGPKVGQLFSWRDPLPALYRLYQLKSRPRVRRALTRWLSTAS
jgi:predicted ATP-grasp superfamily ATP-dependent carboligase